jgi:hypothetical protein
LAPASTSSHHEPGLTVANKLNPRQFSSIGKMAAIIGYNLGESEAQDTSGWVGDAARSLDAREPPGERCG